MRSKSIKFVILLTVLIPALLQSNAQISGFNAYRDNQRIHIEWTTESESNCLRFEIQRSSDKINWQRIGVVKSKTGNSNAQQLYQYIDDSLAKSNDSSINYQLLIVDRDGTTHTHNVVASITGSSGIKHTWGSLKAMFR
jgi:hypothetical protein